jgi:hypothetical protein
MTERVDGPDDRDGADDADGPSETDRHAGAEWADAAGGADETHPPDPGAGPGDDESTDDRVDGLRSALGGAADSLSTAARRTGETLDDSTAEFRRDAVDRAREGAAEASDRIRDARDSIDALRDEEADGAGSIEDLPVPERAVDDLPVERTRTHLDATGRSVRRVGETARATAAAQTDVVRRAAADAGVRAREGAAKGLEDLAHTVRNAEKQEVALWGIGASLAISNPAVAAAYPTYAILSAGMVAGMGIGAYVSSHDDTPLDDVNPLTLGREARRGSRRTRDLGGRGAAVGALSAVGSRLAADADTDSEYARWLADADTETALEGAKRAARRSDDPWAPVFGGGLGLLYGYASDGSSDDEEVRALLDPDLRAELDDEIAGDETGAGPDGDAAALDGRIGSDDDPAIGEVREDVSVTEHETEDGDEDVDVEYDGTRDA